MTFVFPLLLGGLALVGIPVLIHLIMRRKPIRLPFPAMRFLIPRRRVNMRKLQLRHLLLLALRMLLIAGIVLALTRPRLALQGLQLGDNRPIAVVLIFDTSMSMDYRTGDNVSRLKEAQKHGLELIDQLAEGSRVVILDTGDLAQSTAAHWQQNLNQVRERINGLQLKPANGPVTQALEQAYHILADLAQDQENDRVRQLPRLVFIYSDRTRASWDAGMTDQLRDALDRIPPHLAGLHQAAADLPTLDELLGELRTKLPPPSGSDYADQALLDGLTQLKEVLPHLGPEQMPPDAELSKHINNVRLRARELADSLSQRTDVPDEAKKYRENLLASLNAMLRDLAGVQVFFIDVGIEHPVDLTVVDLMLPKEASGKPRQIFGTEEKLTLRALVQATGKDASTMLHLQVGKRTFSKAVDVKAGQSVTIPFELDCGDFGPGQHSAEARLATQDSLSANNSRFVTFAVRQPRRVLVLADQAEKATWPVHGLQAAGFAPEFQRRLDKISVADLLPYRAVYLIGLAKPPESLWKALEEYVAKGGGLAVVPGGEEMDLKAYNQAPAQKLLPGTWQKIVVQEAKPAAWNWAQDAIYRHPLLHPFHQWRNEERDFFVYPRQATRYWEVQPRAKENVLVSYADDRDRPALLEQLSQGGGKVLMFTTPFDPRKPAWNNYLESITKFYPVLISQCTNYLAGEEESVQLNFVSGQEEPTVPLPPSPRYASYLLTGPDTFDSQVRPLDSANSLALKQAVNPGNYRVDGLPKETSKFTALFSVNLPSEEGDLAQVPIGKIEAVLGAGTVLTQEQSPSLRDIMQDQWSEPAELFPFLMIAILLVLALENLLANKFYRSETTTPRG